MDSWTVVTESLMAFSWSLIGNPVLSSRGEGRIEQAAARY
jgi:hypothetical protein